MERKTYGRPVRGDWVACRCRSDLGFDRNGVVTDALVAGFASSLQRFNGALRHGAGQSGAVRDLAVAFRRVKFKL